MNKNNSSNYSTIENEECDLCLELVTYCDCQRCQECEELSIAEHDKCSKCSGEFY